MTRKRNDNHSTEFGLWLREQEEIDSRKGFVATNIDYMWKNYMTNDWMLIEEKRYGSQPQYAQKRLFEYINTVCYQRPFYKGFYLIVFEKTSPLDGKVFINDLLVTQDELIRFLRFDKYILFKIALKRKYVIPKTITDDPAFQQFKMQIEQQETRP